MVNRLGISQNNPFERGSPRAAQRQLHLKNTEDVLARANNLKNKTQRRQGSFGDIVEAVIVGEESKKPEQVQARKEQNDAWETVAAKMRYNAGIQVDAKPQEKETIESLAAEVKSLRQDLNRLMAKQDRPQPSAADLRQHHPGQLHSFNKNLGYGYQIHPNA